MRIRPTPVIEKAKAASFLVLRKNKSAATKTIRTPGSSRGNSRRVLCKLLILKLSFKKLLNIVSYIPEQKLKIKVARIKSLISLSIPLNF